MATITATVTSSCVAKDVGLHVPLLRSDGAVDTTVGTPAHTPSIAPTPRLAQAQVADAEDQLMPRSFELYLLAYQFCFMANYTAVLPTAHRYMLALGGNSWLAGLMVAVGISSGLLTLPIASWMVRRTYKPALYVLTVLCFVGNGMYALGQTMDSPWLLIAGQATKSVMYGSCGNSLSNHATYACVGKKARSSSMALWGNVQFAGMGMGPFFGALLTKISFRIGWLDMDEYTNPGWLFSLVWLAMLAGLSLAPEPPRLFEEPQAIAQGGQAWSATLSAAGDFKISWGLLTVMISTGAVAIWEASATLVTQHYFGWSVMSCCLFIGMMFLVSMAGGEALRVAAVRLSTHDASLTRLGLVGLALFSLTLYKYLPISAAEGLLLSNQVVYIVASALLLTCSNATRSYSNAIAMRQASAISRECKDAACVGVSLVLTLGRGAGAFFGMWLATFPGGFNSAAACIAGLSMLMLMPLAAPAFLKELRSA